MGEDAEAGSSRAVVAASKASLPAKLVDNSPAAQSLVSFVD